MEQAFTIMQVGSYQKAVSTTESRISVRSLPMRHFR